MARPRATIVARFTSLGAEAAFESSVTIIGRLAVIGRGVSLSPVAGLRHRKARAGKVRAGEGSDSGRDFMTDKPGGKTARASRMRDGGWGDRAEFIGSGAPGAGRRSPRDGRYRAIIGHEQADFPSRDTAPEGEKLGILGKYDDRPPAEMKKRARIISPYEYQPLGCYLRGISRPRATVFYGKSPWRFVRLERHAVRQINRHSI